MLLITLIQVQFHVSAAESVQRAGLWLCWSRTCINVISHTCFYLLFRDVAAVRKAYCNAAFAFSSDSWDNSESHISWFMTSSRCIHVLWSSEAERMCWLSMRTTRRVALTNKLRLFRCLIKTSTAERKTSGD